MTIWRYGTEQRITINYGDKSKDIPPISIGQMEEYQKNGYLKENMGILLEDGEAKGLIYD